MKMPGQNERSLELLRLVLAEQRIPAVKKKMFGHETYFFRDYMFAGVFGDDIFVHVGTETAETSKSQGVGFFEPMGKRMRSYVTLPQALQNATAVADWLAVGRKYVETLPKKTPGKISKPPTAAKAPKKAVRISGFKPKKTKQKKN